MKNEQWGEEQDIKSQFFLFFYCRCHPFDYSIFKLIAVLLNVSSGFMVPETFSQTLYNVTYQQQRNADVYGACQKISWRGRWCVGGSLVAVVVVVLLVVEAAVLEGLVPFLVPVTNSICGNKQAHQNSDHYLRLLGTVLLYFNCEICCVNYVNLLRMTVYYRVGDKWSRASNWHDRSGLRSNLLWVTLLAPCWGWWRSMFSHHMPVFLGDEVTLQPRHGLAT